jgi:hypothetical protein
MAITLMAVSIAGCGDSNSAKKSGTATKPATTPATTTSSPTPPTTDSTKPPIAITKPAPLDIVVGSTILEGTATATEGLLNWELVSNTKGVVDTGSLNVSCGAPCRGKFHSKISLPKKSVPAGNYELHVFEPSADDSNTRLHETLVPITVYAKPPAEPVGEMPGK